MSESAGRVLMIPKGTYSPTTTYDPLDAVKYEQNSYVCKQTSRGNLPTNTTYWQPLTDVTADENPTEDSTNLVQSGGVYSALRTINQTLTNQVKDMNNVYGSKNLLIIRQYTRTFNGVSITVNDDGSISFKGTPSATFNLSANTRQIAEDQLENDWVKPFLGKECIFSSGIDYDMTSANITIAYKMTASDTLHYIRSGSRFTFNEIPYLINVSWYLPTTLSFDTTWKPMIRLASIEDDTYVPPTKTNLQLTQDSVTWDNLSEVGAVNQLLIKTSGDTILSNGVYGTYNSDNTITLHGTATDNLITSVEEFKTFKAGTYKLSGAPSMGSSDSLVSLTMRTSSNTIYGGARNDTDGVVFTLPTDTALKLVIYVKKGTNVEGKVVKPMLTPVSYNGPYVPPAKTNKELTDDGPAVKALSFTDYFTLASGFTLSHEVLRKVGNGYSIQATVQGTLVVGKNVIATMSSVLGTATQETIFGAGIVLDGSSVYHPVTVGLPIKANAELSAYTDTAITNGYCTFSLFIPF